MGVDQLENAAPFDLLASVKPDFSLESGGRCFCHLSSDRCDSACDPLLHPLPGTRNSSGATAGTTKRRQITCAEKPAPASLPVQHAAFNFFADAHRRAVSGHHDCPAQ